MLRIGICDDDILMCTYLSELCAKILPGCALTVCQSGAELLDGGDFDILLMDIRLGQMDGLETVQKLRLRSGCENSRLPAVIFITAYDSYVFPALDLYAFHYLLKPLDEEKFARALLLAADECSARPREKALFFHTKSSHLRIFPRQIYYVESNLRKVTIHMERENFELYATMAEMETLLGSRFYRCHRGYLVNLEKISSYNRQTIRLTDGSSLLLAKSKYPEFVEIYLGFLVHCGGS